MQVEVAKVDKAENSKVKNCSSQQVQSRATTFRHSNDSRCKIIDFCVKRNARFLFIFCDVIHKKKFLLKSEQQIFLCVGNAHVGALERFRKSGCASSGLCFHHLSFRQNSAPRHDRVKVDKLSVDDWIALDWVQEMKKKIVYKRKVIFVIKERRKHIDIHIQVVLNQLFRKTKSSVNLEECLRTVM